MLQQSDLFERTPQGLPIVGAALLRAVGGCVDAVQAVMEAEESAEN